jgi:CubicO group peptidase (beta-lactamase class C family)
MLPITIAQAAAGYYFSCAYWRINETDVLFNPTPTYTLTMFIYAFSVLRHPRTPALLLALTTGSVAHADFDADQFTAMVKQGMHDAQIAGLSVAVLDAGETVYLRGFGKTALPDGDAIDTSTYFLNASTTKAMVAAGLLMLVDENRLSLDDLLIDHLPEVHFADPALTAQLTLRDLFTHRTGLPSTDFWTFNQGMPLADQIPRLRSVIPVAAPRTRKIYQNTMYELLGLVLERAAQQPWEEFLSERLWQPIGMGTVATRSGIPKGALQAQPFDVINGIARRVDHSLRAHVSDAAGSAWSSLDDMVLWVEFLLRGGVTADGQRLLSPAAMDAMFKPQQLIAREDYYPSAALTAPNWISYGLGWYQQDFQGRKIDYHTGSLNGGTAIVGLDRQAGRAIVVLLNHGSTELRHALLWWVMDNRDSATRRDWLGDVQNLYAMRAEKAALSRAALDAAQLNAAPSLPLRSYTGHFDSDRGGPLELILDGDRLRLNTLVRTYELTPWHVDTFMMMHKDWEAGSFVNFSLTPAGTVDGLKAFGIKFERVTSVKE